MSNSAELHKSAHSHQALLKLQLLRKQRPDLYYAGSNNLQHYDKAAALQQESKHI
jgi:hypothetical protein